MWAIHNNIEHRKCKDHKNVIDFQLQKILILRFSSRIPFLPIDQFFPNWGDVMKKCQSYLFLKSKELKAIFLLLEIQKFFQRANQSYFLLPCVR